MATPLTVDGVEGARSLVGKELGPSDWVEITQDMVNLFADATGDQWGLVDVERTTKESPFGGPVAQGYLALSLWPRLAPQLINVTGFSMGVNYGTAKVRFPAPVPVGSKLRAKAVVDSVTDVAGGIQMQTTATFEIDGGTEPVCVAVILVRRYT